MDVFMTSVTELEHPCKVQISDNKDMVNFIVTYFLNHIPVILNFRVLAESPFTPKQIHGVLFNVVKVRNFKS